MLKAHDEPTYQELLAQADKLSAEAQEPLRKELKAAAKQVKKLIESKVMHRIHNQRKLPNLVSNNINVEAVGKELKLLAGRER